jgi:diguanylate cyclase (GGDEF)-like protein
MPQKDWGSTFVASDGNNAAQPRLDANASAGKAAIRTPRWLRRGIGKLAPTFKAETLWPELLALACFLILPWIGISEALHQEYGHARAAAEESTATLARALEESARRTIGQIDYILISARAQRAALGDRFDFQDWVRTQTLPDKMTAQIATADREGLVTASTTPLTSAVSVVDRPQFRIHVNPAHDDLFISRPVVGRAGTLQFSRKLLSPDGSFDGVIILSLGSAELARFYDSLKLGKGFVSIISTDGIIMARGPTVDGLVGSSVIGNAASATMLNQPAGSVELASSVMHRTVIVSFRRLLDYPLVVMVAFDTDTVFQAYDALRTNALCAGAAIDVAVGLVGFFWLRQKRRSLASRRALTVTLDTISQGILMVDERGGISVINPRVIDLLGRPDERSEGTREFVAARASALVASQLAAAGPASVQARNAYRHESKFETTLDNGTVIEVRTHALHEGGFVQTYTDITEKRLAHAQVFHLAHHDTLTGLANRVALMQRISAIVGQEPASNDLTALVMIDLDGFKGVNDTLGHDAGDALLIEVAGRLRTLVRGSDLVARLGGDEFVFLLPGLRQREDILPLAERVLRCLAEPARILGQHIRVGASLGIAFYPQDGLDADTWFKHADMALYCAKNSGRGVYRCFDQQLSQAMTEHHLLESDLRRALDGGELEVYFQPKFDSRTLEIVGFEALARWRHPTRGFVSPAVFIRIAEDCGLIIRLGRWVLEQACQCVATWEPRYPVAVNVSVMQLRDGGLKNEIAAVLARTGLRPDQLELEVTESVMAEDDPTVIENLRAAKAMGILIALDDFGTGYSSLSYLRRFPFDKVKIDRSFVQGQADDPGMRVILEAILGMCHNLGLSTIGEGVETQTQLDLLADRGCTEIQGFLLGRPMPREQIQNFIRSKLSGPFQSGPFQPGPFQPGPFQAGPFQPDGQQPRQEAVLAVSRTRPLPLSAGEAAPGDTTVARTAPVPA